MDLATLIPGNETHLVINVLQTFGTHFRNLTDEFDPQPFKNTLIVKGSLAPIARYLHGFERTRGPVSKTVFNTILEASNDSEEDDIVAYFASHDTEEFVYLLDDTGLKKYFRDMTPPQVSLFQERCDGVWIAGCIAEAIRRRSSWV